MPPTPGHPRIQKGTMDPTDLKPGVIIRSPVIPEPIRSRTKNKNSQVGD